jgi:hypothetical protein
MDFYKAIPYKNKAILSFTPPPYDKTLLAERRESVK